MLNKAPIVQLNDFFTALGKRRSRGVYFYRFNGYNQQVHEFIMQYHEAARRCGVIIEGRLENPDSRMLEYYGEMMGMDFRLDQQFIRERMHKWLPRMSNAQCENVSASVFNVLNDLKRAGKNDNMLKNVYIKFMCWMYYKLERIIHKLGDDDLPKILYEGDVSNYELLLLNVMCIAGCDIVLLQYHGDQNYLQHDPRSELSTAYAAEGLKPFPEDFSLKKLRDEIREIEQLSFLYGTKPQIQPCTNAWLSGEELLTDLRKPCAQRGTDSAFYYNCFARISGTSDKPAYYNTLFQFKQDLDKADRRLVIVNAPIPQPVPEELNAVNRKNYQRIDQLIQDLSVHFNIFPDAELQHMLRKAFVDIMIAESRKQQQNINQLTAKAVFLISWLKRYQQALFGKWKLPEIPMFILMGGCRDENEALFCRFLGKLPVDVVIFAPDLSKRCCLSDPLLFEEHHDESLEVEPFPEQQQSIRMGTAAYHAERELDTLMYEDSGMYRNQQYDHANIVTLQTMYEEIGILWGQELKYRPNFSVTDGVVNIPVIFSKVVGVKDGDASAYWQSVKQLMTPDTIVISSVPYYQPNRPNPIRQFVPEFFRNGKLQKQRIKQHPAYPYGILREPIQDYMLEKLESLIQQKIIKGTFENGMEFNIIATVLNLDKQTVRLIQKFDFTKSNPKVIYIVPSEAMLSVEDAIYFSFLNMIGFDVAFFVPTGYQCFEMHLNKKLFDEHQIGEYQYDMRIPNFRSLPSPKRHKWRDKIFKRGT